ncbi:Outer membrane protein beta-barrel domain-containing protein [Saccharicrinis carchari]|uniref:Outer membrane protein beta-barrel domain-containing protein n=1 Tax=Saccharicrinis carchari TaxID=1168039 RepID=A0A521AG74_SACCC|nr:outer membrane beta-barrel protein [Saccharicrinis carchari]SMO33801.1 Outer membrane protein beta-barrel domain-containing protein [Saccharicrinis carchari]
MKQLSLTIAFFLGVLSSTLAQPLTFGQQSIGISIGIPSMYDHAYTKQSPAISALYEYGISDKIGIGYIGVGGLLSLAGGEYNAPILSQSVSYKLSQTLIGPRAAYHFDMVDLTGNKDWQNLDVYSGAFLGLKFESAKYTEPNTSKKLKNNNTKLVTDLFAGIRYAFTPHIGAFGEIGFGVSYLSVGVSFRF